MALRWKSPAPQALNESELSEVARQLAEYLRSPYADPPYLGVWLSDRRQVFVAVLNDYDEIGGWVLAPAGDAAAAHRMLDCAKKILEADRQALFDELKEKSDAAINRAAAGTKPQ